MAQFISKRLKKLPGIWRMDGVAEVTNRGHSGNSCYAHFSQIHESKIKAPYEWDARTPNSATLSCHIATLSEYRVGTIWKDGKLYSNAPQVDGSYTLDVRNCRYVKLWDTVDLTRLTVKSFLDESQMRYGPLREHLSRTYYAIVPVLNNARISWLIIPASELLRFYCGPSSRVLASTVRGSLSDYISFDPSLSYLAGHEVVLRNRNRLTRLEAIMFGRLVASSYAMNEARHIHQHLAATSANTWRSIEDTTPRLTLHARFPFQEQTTLAVLGKEISITGIGSNNQKASEKAIYAMEIVKCSHSLGFEKILQNWDDVLPNSTGGSGQVSRPKPSALAPRFEEEDKLEVVDTAPNARIQRLVVRNAASPFSDMANVSFSYRRQGEGPLGDSSDSSGRKEDILVDALSMGDGSNSASSNNIAGLDSYQYHIDHAGRDLGVFLEMLDHMRRLDDSHDWHIMLRGLSNPVNFPGAILTCFPSDMGPKRRWHQIEDGAIRRPRHIAAAEIVFPSNRKCYLLEMELGATKDGQCTLFIRSPDFAEIPSPQFDLLFRLSAMQRRWIGTNSKWSEKEEKERRDATEFLEKYVTRRLPHPHAQKISDRKDSPREIDPLQWAKGMVQELIGLMTPQGPQISE